MADSPGVTLLSTAPSKQYHKVLLLLGVCSLLLYGIDAVDGEFAIGWDAPTHLFMASSYLQNWWATWDPRWFGGYAEVSYPPLAHQLIAAATWLTGDLGRSYDLVALGFLAVGPYAAFRFARAFVEENAAFVAAVLFVVLPSTRTIIAVYGDLPALAAIVFLLLALGHAADFVRSGSPLDGVIASALMGCCAASHTNTLAFLAPPGILLVLLVQFARAREDRRFVVARSLALLLACVATVLVVIWPFWVWLAGQSPQTPIPHFSRDLTSLDVYLPHIATHVYGPFLILIIGSIVAYKARSALLPLAVVALLFMILSVGGLTPVPSLLLGQWWTWQTYERYGYWANLLWLPIVAEAVVSWQKPVARFGGWTVVAILVGWFGAAAASPTAFRIAPTPVDVTPIVSDLRASPACADRFLAFGLGPSLPYLSISTGAATWDGLWYTARRDQQLRLSGIGEIGDALEWPGGEAFLVSFLARTDIVPANCIYVDELSDKAASYRAILERSGWAEAADLSPAISKWTKPDARQEPGGQGAGMSQPEPLAGFLWGLLPFTCFGVAMAGIGASLRRNHVSFHRPPNERQSQ